MQWRWHPEPPLPAVVVPPAPPGQQKSDRDSVCSIRLAQYRSELLRSLADGQPGVASRDNHHLLLKR